MTCAENLVVTPLTDAPFGCKVTLPSYADNDPINLSDADMSALRDAVLTHLVAILPNQASLKPKSQYLLTKRFDPSIQEKAASTGVAYGHGKELRHEQSVLRKDGCSVKLQPQVQILGQGVFGPDDDGNENGEEISLTHPSHTSFHHSPLTADEIRNKHQTRFYRWHVDSALYDSSAPVVTTLLGIKVPPASQKQIIDYADGSGDMLQVVQGATCFVNGQQAFDRLSDEEKEFALSTTVEYAPYPYIFISPAKATSDGLTMVSEGKERPLLELPEWEESKVKRLPMVWTNPVTKKHHLQLHGCCLFKFHTTTEAGTVTMGLEESRKKAHSLMRPAISPNKVLAHAWAQGDLVMFYNRGVWHTVTGEFKGLKADGSDERRLMHQCNLASGSDPITVR